MRAKKQKNGNAKVKAPKGDAAVNKETVAVTTKTNNRKRQSTEASQAVPAKIIKKQEGPVLSPVAKSKKRKDKKRAAAAAASGNVGRVKAPKDEGKEKEKQALAIAYLKLWKDDRKNWKFKKINQMWLNDNMLSSVMVPDDIFPIWLEYMVGSTGGQKKWLVKRSAEILAELEADEGTADASDVKYERAKQIIQTLHVEEEEKDSEKDGEDDDSST